VTTHSKSEHYNSKGLSTIAQEEVEKKITEDQVGRIERR
jgi:hypothetical protein